MLKKFCAVLLLCIALKSGAQVFYSTDPGYLKYKTEKNNLLSEYRPDYPDSTLTEHHNFFQRNFMGNIGMPSPNYILNYGTDNIGFTLFQPPTLNDRFRESQVEYYRSKGPYANLTGILGSKQLQVFKMMFTGTYKQKVNFTLKFNRYASLGYYLKQQTYTNNFFLTSNYTTDNKRFGYYFYVLNNTNKNQENGGIREGQLNDSTLAIDKLRLLTRITTASRDNRETKVMANPWFRLNKKSDSSTVLDHYIQLKSKASFNLYRYKDQISRTDNFYKLIYLDTVKSFDSSHVTQYSNEIDYSVISANKKIGLSAGYRNEINRVWQHGGNTFYNHIAVADLSYRTGDSLNKKGRGFESRLNGQYVAAGYNAGNFKAESNSLFIIDNQKKQDIFLNVLFEKRSADYIYTNWISNHFQWMNYRYNAQDQFQVNLGASFGRYISASVFYQAINNYLYFDNVAMPRQYNGLINNTGVTLNFTKTFFKHLGLGAGTTFQNTSNTNYVRMPSNVTTLKLFYSGNLFKNNMQLQIGSQLQVYQSFYGYAYMPATEVFYLQNQTTTGTYPYLDVYLNARIRPVTVFLKIENVLQGFAGTNYSFVPGYYQTERAFRFGISWIFFD